MNQGLQKFKEKSYYELLGISPGATREEIKVAYRDLVRIYHPDSNYYRDIINDTRSLKNEEIFKLITEAYKTLSAPEKREMYDLGLPRSEFPENDFSAGGGDLRGSPIARNQFGRPVEGDEDSAYESISKEDLRSLSERMRERGCFDYMLLIAAYGIPLATVIGLLAFFLI